VLNQQIWCCEPAYSPTTNMTPHLPP
jgi:hypothetical protein